MKALCTSIAGILLTVGCGLLEGEGVSLNDPIPTGAQQVKAGTFQGGQAQGLARIYANPVGSGNFIVRLESFSISETALPLNVIAVGSQGNFSSPLRAASGNQNYSFSAASNSDWSMVELRAPGNISAAAGWAVLSGSL